MDERRLSFAIHTKQTICFDNIPPNTVLKTNDKIQNLCKLGGRCPFFKLTTPLQNLENIVCSQTGQVSRNTCRCRVWIVRSRHPICWEDFTRPETECAHPSNTREQKFVLKAQQTSKVIAVTSGGFFALFCCHLAPASLIAADPEERPLRHRCKFLRFQLFDIRLSDGQMWPKITCHISSRSKLFMLLSVCNFLTFTGWLLC